MYSVGCHKAAAVRSYDWKYINNFFSVEEREFVNKFSSFRSFFRINLFLLIKYLFFCFSSSSLLLLMGRLKHGYMIIWVQELIMMPLGILAQQWPIVLMAQGKINL